MDHLQNFASFLLSKHLDGLTSEYRRLLQENDSLLRQYIQEPATGAGNPDVHQALEHLLNTMMQPVGLLTAAIVLPMPGQKSPAGMVSYGELVAYGSLCRQLLLQFVPLFTRDIEVYHATAVALEEFFRQYQWGYLQHIDENRRESERRFQLLADQASDMISTHTPEGVFTYVSPSCKPLLGYAETELVGRQVYEMFHPEDIAQIQERHANSLEVPDVQHVTYRIRTKSGEYRWFESVGRSIRDPLTGQVVELQLTSRDITLRKQAEEALHREQQYLQSILEHISDGIVACDAAGNLSFFNEAARQFHGLPEQPIAPEQWAEDYSLYQSDGVTPLQTADIPLFKAYRGETVNNIEMVIAPAQGKKMTLLASGNQILSKNGQLLGAVVVMHDITGQKAAQQEMVRLNTELKDRNEELSRTEEMLTELNSNLEAKVLRRAAELEGSLQQFKFLADSVPQIIWTADAGGNVTYFNQNWYDFTRLSPEESIRWGWQIIIHPDDLPNCLQRWAYAIKTGELYEVEYRLRRNPEGTYRWHLGRGVPMRDSKGRITEWFGSCTDIHDQKLAEEELKAKNRTLELLNEVGMTLSAELDLQKIVQRVTDVATEVTGAQFGAFFYNQINEKREQLTLYTISGVPREAFSKFPMPRNTAIFSPTFHGEGVVRSDDITQDGRYGKNAPYQGMPEGHLPVRSYLAVSVVSRNGQVLGGLFFGHSQPGIFTVQAEELAKGIASQAAIAIDNSSLFDTLREKNRELVRTNADLDNFMYTASHDLKAPIANLSSLFSLLNRRLKGKIEGHDLPLFDMINHSISQFNRTIRDLTEVVSIQKETEGVSQVAFREVLESVQTDIAQMLVESGGTVETELNVESVRIEKKNLRSLLYNLITNAIKYRSPERSLIVQVTSAEEGTFVVLTIRDNGLGLTEAQKSKLFTLFKRMHTHVEGSGVGLYIVKRIVENAGGRIEVESEAELGTTFRIFFRK